MMKWISWYFLIINIIGFALFLINMYLYSHTDNKHVDPLLTFVSLLGGTIGIIIPIVLFDRKAVKQNMMSRVFVWCLFISQITCFLIYKQGLFNNFSIPIISFFKHHKFILWYLILINILTFIFFGIDKYKAINKKYRISIVTLLLLAGIGGSLGALSAMYIFRHKTKKDYFTVGIPLIIVMQIVLLFYISNTFN